MTTNQIATCSVCLGTFVLGASRLVRHGFSIITSGRGHGHHGAWHTGPCAGPRFPHLGISTEGTLWALAQIADALAAAEDYLAELQTGTAELAWTEEPRRQRNRALLSKTLVPGDQEVRGTQATDWVAIPSYEVELARRIRLVTAKIKGLTVDRDTCRNVIAEWSAEKYPVQGKPRKVPLTHMLHTKRSGARVPLCRSGSIYPVNAQLTEDSAKVDCPRCKAVMVRLGL